tara:strand:- start:176 stop:373 length:198 start_codon:yes stop_codon:yes gene_type:complete
MSVVKERYAERFIERVEETVDRYIDNMDLEQLVEYTATSMKDYYVNVASGEEVDEFLKEYEPLPF